jgi:hypothetical protein
MSNLTTILEVAGNVAFSNLFEVEVGTNEFVKHYFKLHIENITLPGMELAYIVEESTKKHKLQSATKIRQIKLRIREKGNYYFYQYLLAWYTDFYDPITNRFKSGNEPNVQKATAIVKTRTLKLKAYSNDEKRPNFQLVTNSAMLQNLPALNFDYSSSKPLIYDVTFIVDNINLTAGSTVSGFPNSLDTTPTPASASVNAEETFTQREFDPGETK